MHSQVISFKNAQNICEQCGIYRLCLPMGLKTRDLDMLDSIIKRSRPVKKGEHIFQTNQSFTSIYALRSGSIKSYIYNEQGEEHIIGFKMPGDLLGLSGINGSRYQSSAIALETSNVCEIPFSQLESLGQKIPGLSHHLIEIMSREIQEEQQKVTMCSMMSAEARLASVIYTISQRFAERGFSATEFHLSMSRSDIANMLGLAVETVSRLFTQFQEQGILSVNRKHIQILDVNGLTNLIRTD